MDYEEIKHRLRKLKKLEISLRFHRKEQPNPTLIWDSFFDLHDGKAGKVKYTPETLAAMTREEYKAATGEYLSFLYNAIYSINTAQDLADTDPQTLFKTGLPADADEKEIKRRFRELAKIYHPDTGGDSIKFTELMEVYKKTLKK